jgi:hypothetical protein
VAHAGHLDHRGHVRPPLRRRRAPIIDRS